MAEELHVRFGDHAALEREYATNLAHGRAFVADAEGYEVFAPCRLVLHHPQHAQVLHIDCEVVMVRAEGPLRGVAVQFRDRSQATLDALHSFVTGQFPREQAHPPEAPEATSSPSSLGAAYLEDCAAASAAGRELAPISLEDCSATTDTFAQDVLALDAEPDADDACEARTARSPSAQRMQRMRNLSPAERLKIAQGPVLDDRVLLERMYGNVVWEALLHNPRISVPEVARMARKGTLPRPLLEFIVENEQWIRQSVVRRALLSNPRLSADAAAKVLRTMNARELKLVPQQTAYPALVRQTALRLMRGG